MENQSTFKLTGSYKPLKADVQLQETDKDENITVTVRLRRKKELPTASLTGETISRATY